MKTLNLILISILFNSLSGLSQVKVYNNGKALFGEMIPYWQDHNNELTIQVLGKNDIGGGSKIALGDYGKASTGSRNVMIAEYGETDSDKLWLHGKFGIYLTRDNGDYIIGKYDITEGNKFTFNCDVYSYGTKLTSDERFKTNIKDIDSSLTQLRKLKGVSYNYDFPGQFGTKKTTQVVKSTTLNSEVSLSKKEKRDNAILKEFNEEIERGQKRLGFIAQDLQKVFPELVEQDSAGYYYVDYVGLIPVIIEALKEQQSQIDVQNKKIKKLNRSLNNCCSQQNVNNDKSTKENANLDDISSATLFQNVPNPFSYDTEISFFIPDEAGSCELYIFDLQGKLVMNNTINQKGKGSITINGSALEPGMYIYSLYIDGAEIDTKRMILTE